MAIKITQQAQERLREIRGDASAGIYFSRELESIEATLYEIKKRELKYRELIPVSNRDPAGAETITYRMMDKLGVAKVIANYADDLPRADALLTEHTQSVRTVATAFGYTVQDIQAGQMVGRSIDTLRAAAARRVYREKESKIAWNGDSDYDLLGLLDNPNIGTLTAPDPGSGSEWVNKTPDEILDDIITTCTDIREDSQDIHKADTLLLPIEQHSLLMKTPRSPDNDTTIGQFILNNREAYGIERIEAVPELKGSGTGGIDQLLLYELDSEVLEQRIPREMGTEPVQSRNLEFVVPIWGRHGGVVVRFPLALRFMEGI